MYKEYFSYIIEHKKNVFRECIELIKTMPKSKDYRKYKLMMLIHAFTHDLSKFLPNEFYPYAEYFYGYHGVKLEKEYNEEQITNGMSCVSRNYLECKKEFDKAWELHYKRNKHHPEYWNGKKISYIYILQMICDLKAMSRKFGGTAQEYYLRNYNKWNLNRDSRYSLEINLDLISKYNAPICEGTQEYWMTIKELIEYEEKYLESNIENSRYKNAESYINDLLKPACDKYKINIYQLIVNS
jgi:hypothetical protein